MLPGGGERGPASALEDGADMKAKDHFTLTAFSFLSAVSRHRLELSPSFSDESVLRGSRRQRGARFTSDAEHQLDDDFQGGNARRLVIHILALSEPEGSEELQSLTFRVLTFFFVCFAASNTK